MVNNLLATPYLADTGSEETYIPRQYLEELISVGAALEVVPLSHVEKKSAAGGNYVECREAVTLDLLLQTAAGQVHMPEVYSGPPAADGDPFDLGVPDIVPPSGVREKLNEMVVVAGDNGFDSGYLDSLREIVFEYEDVIRIDLLADPPAKVEPLRITLRSDAKRFRARPRRYSPAQSAFLSEHVRSLEKMGYIRRDNMSVWACAAVPVPKDSMSFITDEGVWTPSRVPQGTMDSPLHFQNQMNVVFEDIQTTHAKWCGQLFSGVGVRHDPERLSGLHQLPLTSTAADLQQFLCATGWMRGSLMDYSRVIQPLHDKLEAVLKVVGRTKRLAAGAAITWTAADSTAFETARRTAFETARQLLTTSQTLHYPSQNASIVLMSDASDRGWGSIVTQVKDWVDGLPVTDQRHELLVCKSGKFDDTASRWSIIEKEAFPIIWAARNLTYLLVRDTGFRIYCDHKNLIYVFSPDQEVKRHVRGKLQRWAMSLTGLQSQIEHVDGSINLWADLLSRWGLSSREEGGVTKCKAITRSRTHETISTDTQMRRLHLRAGSFVIHSLSEIQTA
ncbi:Hypothetical protein PHPALM_37843 [Phytophthora palmivora]|uniref:Reverse transcriptase RNase H-like domain-containing protein n=1 Tax=Phytophthora palmivora TaxID=4796 RepID=A0A2P4WWE8_9STRA|nr:Hypothetical protein PHPALM_37843 [Phytophthora palmivora]